MLKYSIYSPIDYAIEISQPLPQDIAEDILLNKTCHVDHEGFDLNEIEQAYYKHNDIILDHDTTWYKDGDAAKGAHGIIQPWIVQTPDSETQLLIDHSQFVYRYPIVGLAAKQIEGYVTKRPELLRILNTEFKCGLDLCIDYKSKTRVSPVVHIEWDFACVADMHDAAIFVEKTLETLDWDLILKTVKRFNELTKRKLDAFEQADFRSLLVFGKKSYKLIPTLF